MAATSVMPDTIPEFDASPDRWVGVHRPYTSEQVERLRNTIAIEHTLANVGSRRLWELLHSQDYVAALGALTGNQAMQQVRAGLKAIYVSGWQVAADANQAGQTYPDQSLYPANSVPQLVRRINQALMRADQIHHAEQSADAPYWFAPIVADAEAGFGGPLNVFELMKAMIEAGAAGVHFEDQLSSEKKCGHLGGKVLIPTGHFIRTLVSARLAADVLNVPAVLIARTDADSAKLLTSDVDPRDHEFMTGERTPEGYHRISGAWSAPSPVPEPTPPTPTCCGAKHPSRIWSRPAGSRRRSGKSIRASCWRTTARRRSIGAAISMRPPSPSSSANSAPWGTSTSS